ncbi:MAG: beta-N-acetylhexosaminidase [Alphaproteobacteria bacterium]
MTDQAADPAPRAAIFGCSGPLLTPGEQWFFREADPWGFILFTRNCRSRNQIADLVQALRACVGRPDAPVLIDQEGGRVQRLGPPDWPAYPSAEALGSLHGQNPDMAHEAVTLQVRLMAHDLRALGITVDCLPVADVPAADEHGIIGDRAYGRTADVVAALAGTAAQALLAEGVLPVLKHLPGHGRARADSHETLPVVDASWAALSALDFAAFRPLCGLPLGMSAHVVYSAIDPEAPATWSARVIGEVIRAEIGFDGLLMTDDLSMGALSGPFSERAARSFAAGCDVVLHCNGRMDEMVEIAAATPRLGGDARRRADRALASLSGDRSGGAPFDPEAAWAKLRSVIDSRS